MRKAVIRESDGLVINVIEWATDSTLQPPIGHILIDADNCNPGDTWDGVKFVKLEALVVPQNPDIVTLRKYLADPHSGLPDLESAFIALVKLYLGE